MANAVQHSSGLRNDIANLVTGTATTFAAGTAQKLILYSGAVPATASTALSGNTAIATITGITWGAASGGVASTTASTADPSAVGGTATFFRLYKTAATDPASVIIQGTAGVGSSFDFNMTGSATISAGATYSLTSGSYTAPL